MDAKKCCDGEIGIDRNQVALYLWTQIGHAPEGVKGIAASSKSHPQRVFDRRDPWRRVCRLCDV